jgi:hypothetical protein
MSSSGTSWPSPLDLPYLLHQKVTHLQEHGLAVLVPRRALEMSILGFDIRLVPASLPANPFYRGHAKPKLTDVHAY